MFCQKCGSQIDDNDTKFCPECGSPTSESIVPPPPQPPESEIIPPVYPPAQSPAYPQPTPPAYQPLVPQQTPPPKKNTVWFVLGGVLLVLIVAGIALVALGLKNDKDEGKTRTTQVTQATTAPAEETTIPGTTAVAATTTPRNDLVQDSLIIIKDAYTGLADVTLDETELVFYITPTDSALNDVIWDANEGYEDAIADWNEIVDSIVDLSITIADYLPGYAIGILNPENTENMLLMVDEGEVLYNFLED
jgi:hypothetical protein